MGDPDPHNRYQVDAALLDAGIIPERFRHPPDWKRTTGRGGVYEMQGGIIRVVCEAQNCPNNFSFRSLGEPPDAGLQKTLEDRGWSFHEHYIETQAEPVLRQLWCAYHAGRQDA